MQGKRWKDWEKDVVREHFSDMEKGPEFFEEMIPRHSWSAVRAMAATMDIHRTRGMGETEREKRKRIWQTMTQKEATAKYGKQYWLIVEGYAYEMKWRRPAYLRSDVSEEYRKIIREHRANNPSINGEAHG